MTRIELFFFELLQISLENRERFSENPSAKDWFAIYEMKFYRTDISLIDPTIHARKYVDQRTYNPKDYPDAYTFYFMSGYYDEAEATKRYNKYLADVQEIAEDFRKEMERHKLIVFN